MNRIIDHPALSHKLHFIVSVLLILFLHGCAAIKPPVKTFPPPTFPEEKLERNDFSLAKGQDVIGRLASVRLQEGDTLPDIARHFSLGIGEISAANPGVDIWVPEAGQLVILPLSFILPDSSRRGIVINLATMRLFLFKGDGKSVQLVSTYPVGVGSSERPTPRGQMTVTRKQVRPTWHVPASIAADHRKKGDPLPPFVPPGPDNPLGEYALYLSEPSYLIHGTNKPASIGLNATNGCLRLYPENIKKLFDSTPVNTPVNILNQPYLVGQRSGVLYLEAHAPANGDDPGELKKLTAKLKTIERKSGRPINWKRVEEVLAEARGIPIPILDSRKEGGAETAGVVEVRHPEKLYGRPEIPELNMNAWYVLAADLRDRIEAERMAALINHQGPPIPARVLPNRDRYRVIAGPFNDRYKARDAVKRLKIDLEIEGILIEPSLES